MQTIKRNVIMAVLVMAIGAMLAGCVGSFYPSKPRVYARYRGWVCRTPNRVGQYYTARSHNHSAARSNSRRHCRSRSRSRCVFHRTHCRFSRR